MAVVHFVREAISSLSVVVLRTKVKKSRSETISRPKVYLGIFGRKSVWSMLNKKMGEFELESRLNGASTFKRVCECVYGCGQHESVLSGCVFVLKRGGDGESFLVCIVEWVKCMGWNWDRRVPCRHHHPIRND